MILKTTNQVVKHFPEGISMLEIGSGSNPEPGYVHLDIQAGLPDLDILGDARQMPLPDNFVSDHIRAVHIMEHFCHPEYAGIKLQERYGTTIEVLSECYRVLKPGGKLKIVTPDFEKISQSATKNKISTTWLQRWSVGGHLDEYDVHHWLWTKSDAEKWFKQVGFKNLNDWSPVQGWLQRWKLAWDITDYSSPEWHQIEWFHWLFFEGTK